MTKAELLDALMENSEEFFRVYKEGDLIRDDDFDTREANIERLNELNRIGDNILKALKELDQAS